MEEPLGQYDFADARTMAAEPAELTDRKWYGGRKLIQRAE